MIARLPVEFEGQEDVAAQAREQLAAALSLAARLLALDHGVELVARLRAGAMSVEGYEFLLAEEIERVMRKDLSV